MTEIQPRIVSSEIEWAVSERLVGNGEVTQLSDPTSVIHDTNLMPGLIQGGSSRMFSNGSRYYLDVGSHIEYAAPEDTSFEGAMINEIAGERIVIDGLVRYIRSQNKVDWLQLRKRNRDDEGETWGSHLNFSTLRKQIPTVDDESMHALGLHIATSQAMLGSGTLMGPADRRYYSLGQKVWGLHHDYIAGTMGKDKGVINLRDEALADNNKYRRIHITSMDAHISPWATKMALGTCSLVLRAIEQGKVPSNLRLQQLSSHDSSPLVRVAKQSANDLSLKSYLELVGWRSATPLSIQERLVEMAARTYHTDEERVILSEWEQAVHDLASDPMLLINRSDAIAKLGLLRQQAVKAGNDPNNFSTEAAQRLSVGYDTLAAISRDEALQLLPNDATSPESLSQAVYEKSIPHRLRSSLFRGDTVDQNAIARAMFHPPATTRAHLRGEAIRSDAQKRQHNEESGFITSMNWMMIKRDDGETTIYPEPYLHQ